MSMLKKQYLKTKPACKVTFSLPREAAADAEEVRLLGDFNGWEWENGVVMALDNDHYRTTLELETGRRYEFRYLADGKSWLNDWDADEYVPSPYLHIDNSVVVLDPSPAKPKAAKKAPSRKAAEPKVAEPKAAKPKAAKPKVAKPKAAKPAKTKSRPVAAPKPKPKAAPATDDLRRIEGIGPKIAGLLKAQGINSFADLAAAKQSVLRGILDKAGSRYRMHDPKTWPKQAKLAASGEWDKLDKLQKKLKGGK